VESGGFCKRGFLKDETPKMWRERRVGDWAAPVKGETLEKKKSLRKREGSGPTGRCGQNLEKLQEGGGGRFWKSKGGMGGRRAGGFTSPSSNGRREKKEQLSQQQKVGGWFLKKQMATFQRSRK